MKKIVPANLKEHKVPRTHATRCLMGEMKYEPLSDDETVRLLTEIKDGNNKSLEKLIEHNTRLAYTVAIHYSFVKSSCFDFNDIVSEAFDGLMYAVDNWDHVRGAKFSSYAFKCCQGYILKFLSQYRYNAPFRIPQNVSTNIKLIKEYETNAGIHANVMDTKTIPGMRTTKQTMEALLNIKNNQSTHLADPLTVRRDTVTESFYSVLPEHLLPSEYFADARVMKESVQADISRALQTLSFRQRQILILYFGLHGKYFPVSDNDGDAERTKYLQELQMQPEVSYTDLATYYDVSKQRVIQIKQESIRNLRKSSDKDNLFLVRNRRYLLQSHYHQ